MNRMLVAIGVVVAMGLGSLAVAQAPGAGSHTGVKQLGCGEQMKAMVPMPTTFGELMTTFADELNAHAAWVSQSSDKAAKAEASALKKLSADHRAVAKQMSKIVSDMEAAGKVPPAPHDMAKMDPKLNELMLKRAKLQREMASMMVKSADALEARVRESAHATATPRP